MKNNGQNSKKKNFTGIIFIILLLIFFVFLYLPQIMNPGRRGKTLTQKNQLRTIEIALGFFNSENNYYPPSSDTLDPNARPYCGAMKLCEAMLGQDLLGFHPDSVFNKDGVDRTGRQLYDITTQVSRKELYLVPESANVYNLNDIFPDIGTFDGNNYVLCDVFLKRRHSGKKIGMPILYYKADTSKTAHDVNNPDNPDNIYNYKDNHTLLALGTPYKQNKKHPLFENPKLFYKITKNYKITTQSKPHRPDSFILLSAGEDGLYGTWDDIANFEWRWNFE